MLKGKIRSALFALGRTTKENDFRNFWFELEGVNFDELLRERRCTFVQLLQSIPVSIYKLKFHST